MFQFLLLLWLWAFSILLISQKTSLVCSRCQLAYDFSYPKQPREIFEVLCDVNSKFGGNIIKRRRVKLLQFFLVSIFGSSLSLLLLRRNRADTRMGMFDWVRISDKNLTNCFFLMLKIDVRDFDGNYSCVGPLIGVPRASSVGKLLMFFNKGSKEKTVVRFLRGNNVL